MARRQLRKQKAIATATTAAASASSAMSEESSTGSQGGSRRKLRSSRSRGGQLRRGPLLSRLLRNRRLLKRNREAEYKCRLKKKTQIEEVIEQVKVLGGDNAAKVVEVERLRREVEGLKGLLLPHYGGCGDERAVASLSSLLAIP